MRLPKIALLAAALPLGFLWYCHKAQAQTVETRNCNTQPDPPAWENDPDELTPWESDVMPDEPMAVTPDDSRSGTDLFPLKSLRVTTKITGTVAHVVVDQVFGNRNRKPINAVYLFPLPHQAAVHGLTIRTAGQVIKAKLKRKADARRTYEDAARQGKVAALLEQERPNLFQQSVANLMPGSELTVRTVMDMPVTFRGDETEFVFPTAVGPRFCPMGSVPDMGKIGAPRLPEGMVPPQKLSMQVVLDAKMPVSKIGSPSHDLTVSGEGNWEGPVTIALREGTTSPNKDFVLRWCARGDRPLASVVTERGENDGHFLLQIQPPKLGNRESTSGKEVVFLVDQSGSMNGEPISHLKKAMRRALREMDPRDRFQIVGFSNVPVPFAHAPVQATPDQIAKGIAFIEAMDANGGTEMLDGIRKAFSYKPTAGTVRVICLMTDGLVGNENQIVRAVEKEMGEQTRVFTLGIGSSVNRWFLEEVALRGKGQAEVATLDQDPAEAADKFLEKIRRPVMTNIRLTWSGVVVADQAPSVVPDLFDGEPLVVSGRILSGSNGSVTIRGECGGRHLRLVVPVNPEQGEKSSAVGSLWARARIAELERSNQGSPTAATIEDMTQLALKHRLASQYTSFVAVMDEIVNKSGKAKTVAVPLPLPEGVTEKAMGGGSDKMMPSQIVSAPSEGGSTESRTAAWAASPSAPAQVMSAPAPSSSAVMMTEDGQVVDVILAGGGGTLMKGQRGGQGASAGDRMTANEGVGLGNGGRAGFGSAAGGTMKSAKAMSRPNIAPPKPTDVEMTGEIGSRSPESILRVIRAHLGGFRYTYERFLKDSPNLGGKISLKFTIAPSGDIISIEIVTSNTGNAALDTDIKDKARRMKFDPIEKGNVTVSYAFVLDKN